MDSCHDDTRLIAFIDSTVANVALPAIQVGLGGTLTDMQWVVATTVNLLGAR